MELNQQTSRLLILFLIVNLVAAAIGFITIVHIGVLPGLIVFTLLVVLLPVLLQYFYLKTNS